MEVKIFETIIKEHYHVQNYRKNSLKLSDKQRSYFLGDTASTALDHTGWPRYEWILLNTFDNIFHFIVLILSHRRLKAPSIIGISAIRSDSNIELCLLLHILYSLPTVMS